MPDLVELHEPYVPLLPPRANKFLDEIVGDDVRVFEWGAGSSTLWFAQRCCITSVEHDGGWARYLDELAEREGLDVDLRLADREKFPGAILGYDDGYFDLVFVDCWSHIRNRCVTAAVSKIAPGGWLVLDDTQWPRLRPSVRLMSAWKRREFAGIVVRKGKRIVKRGIANLRPRERVEVTKCTFWQNPS